MKLIPAAAALAAVAAMYRGEWVAAILALNGVYLGWRCLDYEKKVDQYERTLLALEELSKHVMLRVETQIDLARKERAQ